MTTVALVPSLSRTDREYAISYIGVDPAGNPILACSCPAFVFGKRARKTCNHIKIYRAARHLAEECLEHHAGDGASSSTACWNRRSR